MVGKIFAVENLSDYNNNVPIIFISALDTESDIISGFNKGGDDYIAKPFSIKEVLARINAVLNRTYNNLPDEKPAATQEKKEISNPNIFVHKELKIEFDKKRVLISGEDIVLTKKENEILILLARNPNKLYSREDILQLVWKEESYVLERTVDVHIARLRKKLGHCGEWIANRSGYGYCMHI